MPRPTLCPYPAHQIKQMYEKIGTIKGLAKKLGITPPTAKRWCRDLGIQTRGRGEVASKRWYEDYEYPERQKTANVSVLQQADPTSFETMANEILSGERIFAPVGIGTRKGKKKT